MESSMSPIFSHGGVVFACGCKVVYDFCPDRKDVHARLDYCSLHKAAPDMYRLIESFVDTREGLELTLEDRPLYRSALTILKQTEVNSLHKAQQGSEKKIEGTWSGSFEEIREKLKDLHIGVCNANARMSHLEHAFDIRVPVLEATIARLESATPPKEKPKAEPPIVTMSMRAGSGGERGFHIEIDGRTAADGIGIDRALSLFRVYVTGYRHPSTPVQP